jgi:hypothetical protein
MRDFEDIDVTPAAGQGAMNRLVERFLIDVEIPDRSWCVFNFQPSVLVAVKAGLLIAGRGRP